jgi:hypothetical protein
MKDYKETIKKHIGTPRDCAQYYALLLGSFTEEFTINDGERSRTFEARLKGEPLITNFKGERVTDPNIYASYLDSGRAHVELNIDASAVIELVEVIRDGKNIRYEIVDLFSSMADVKSHLNTLGKPFVPNEPLGFMPKLTTR